MVGQTSQTVEVERQREADMFKLYEKLTQEVDIYDFKVREAEEVVANFSNRLVNSAVNEANAYLNERRHHQQTYFYRGTQQ